MSAPILKVCPELNEAQLQLLYRALSERLPEKKYSLRFGYQGVLMGVDGAESPEDRPYNNALTEVDTAIREFLGIEDEV